jgi:menaquinone-specific isochorismate synthase
MLESPTKQKTDPIVETKRLLADKIARAAQSSHVRNSKEESRVLRLDAPISHADALSWLAAQPEPIKFYWKEREKHLETAAAGRVDLVSSDGPIDYEGLFSKLGQKLSLADADIRYYGGARFNNDISPDRSWESYGSYRFFLPRFELRLDGGNGYLACNLLVSKDGKFSPSSILAELDAMVFPAKEEGKIPRLVSREDIPDRSIWGQNLTKALDFLHKGSFKKIVLARKSALKFDAKLNAFALLRSLRRKTQDCFHFCFVPGPQTAFIGASPERLYARQGRTLETEALAGTRPRGNNTRSDDKLAKELLQSEKDIREHQFVVDGIQEALSPLCQSLRMQDRLRLLKLARSQHLLCTFQATLNHETTDAQLLRSLHPTPAVGGYPTANALPEIGRLESFDRGWYAGPIGWVGRDQAEFCVAIRSGLVEGSRLYLFAGAGIVEGSTAQGEWREIENKMSDFIKVFAGS